MQNLQSNPLDQVQKTLQLLQLPESVELMLEKIESVNRKLESFQDYLIKTEFPIDADRYMSSDEAQKYLSMSKNTFEKYRYSTAVKIPSYPLDGKCWFRKSDLDRFMLTYKYKKAA